MEKKIEKLFERNHPSQTSVLLAFAKKTGKTPENILESLLLKEEFPDKVLGELLSGERIVVWGFSDQDDLSIIYDGGMMGL